MDVIPHPHKYNNMLRSSLMSRKRSTILAGKGMNQIEEASAYRESIASLR